MGAQPVSPDPFWHLGLVTSPILLEHFWQELWEQIEMVKKMLQWWNGMKWNNFGHWGLK